ncbi:hypothetical protein QBC37DRAFT_370624 [Rhypophila decipiens]|uniref:Uncharacterized protein n=1 Tax=Rhypophila decipiens TaxID=261697 RepID=A0AAN6YET9_9PEZI|nr:hypothetical protein QBC37DRAFT_370624 [Rhypophila decipiens]
MNTQQSDPVPNHRGAPEDAPSPPSAEAGAELTDYNLWQLRKESQKAEAQRKGRSVGSDQPTEPYSPPHFARIKPSTVEVPGIDWAALNAEVSKTHKREPPPSDNARVKFEDVWVFGLDNIRARWEQDERRAVEMAAVTDKEKQTGGLNPNKKRPLDESSEDGGSSTKRQRVEPHTTFGYPGVFSSSYKGPGSNPKALEASSPPVQNEKSKFRSIFGTPAVNDSEPSSSSVPPQQQSVFGHFPPKPPAKPESTSIFGPIPLKPSAKLPVDEASLFGSSNPTPQFSKRPQTTSELFGFNDTASADISAIQASEGATKGPRPTNGLFGFIDATPPDSLAVQAASDDATTKPPPSSGLFGFNHPTPADNDSLMVQASTHITTKPQYRATIAATMDMDAYLSTPNLFVAPSPPEDKPTTTAPAQNPVKRLEPRVYSMLQPKTHSTFSMDTMQERFFERIDANDVIHPLDEAGAPLDLESYLPPHLKFYILLKKGGP